MELVSYPRAIDKPALTLRVYVYLLPVRPGQNLAWSERALPARGEQPASRLDDYIRAITLVRAPARPLARLQVGRNSTISERPARGEESFLDGTEARLAAFKIF